MSDAQKMTNKVPSELAYRYAGALISLAEEGRGLKTVEKDMKTLGGLFSGSPELAKMVKSPIVSDADKSGALLALAKKVKIGKLVSNFIGTVVMNGRAGELPDMIRAFEKMLAEKRGQETAFVRSAKKLSAAEKKSIAATLKKALGRTVAIQTVVDPELLGGFSVQVGSKYYDASLKTKLEGLSRALKEA